MTTETINQRQTVKTFNKKNKKLNILKGKDRKSRIP